MSKPAEAKATPPRTRETRSADFAFALGAVGLIALSMWAYRNLPHITALVLFSALIAYAFLPVVDLLAKRMKRWLALLLVSFVGAGLIAGSIALIAPAVSRQLNAAKPQAEASAQQAAGLWDKAISKLPEAIRPRVEQAKQQLAESPRLEEFGKNVASGVAAVASGAIFVPLFVLGMLYRFHRVLRSVETLIPPRWRPRIRERVLETDVLLSGFVRGMLLTALIIGVLYSIAFQIIGLPLAIPVGLLSGFGELIPYFGNAVALVVGSLLALATGEPVRVLYVVGAFAVIQTFEGLVLGPMIIGRKARLSPLVVIVALAIGGELFGFIGLLLAVPVAAILKVALKAAADGYRATRFFAKDEDSRPTPDVDRAHRTASQ